MSNGPKLWTKLLNESGFGNKTLIMGGAIVDYAANVEPKDYDIFHQYSPGQPELPANWKMTKVDFNDEGWIEEHKELYAQGLDEQGNAPIGSVYEYLVDGEHLVQLIGVHYDDPKKHFKNFDHTLTLGWFSAKGLFVHRKVFQSFDTRTVEYIGKDQTAASKAKSYVRAIKKTMKYDANDPFADMWNYKGFF